jgi:ABC-type branched-subunit amino acid transport system ATPase component
MNFGQQLFAGTPDEVFAHADVIESYLGRKVEPAG